MSRETTITKATPSDTVLTVLAGLGAIVLLIGAFYTGITKFAVGSASADVGVPATTGEILEKAARALASKDEYKGEPPLRQTILQLQAALAAAQTQLDALTKPKEELRTTLDRHDVQLDDKEVEDLRRGTAPRSFWDQLADSALSER